MKYVKVNWELEYIALVELIRRYLDAPIGAQRGTLYYRLREQLRKHEEKD